MSDRFFGMATAAAGGLTQFDSGGRRSGRTTRMIAAVKPGDVIIVAEERGGRNIRALLREAGKDGIEVRAVTPPPDGLYDARAKMRGGSIYPDHTWIFEFLMGGIKASLNTMEQLCISPPGPDPERLDRVWRDRAPRRNE